MNKNKLIKILLLTMLLATMVSGCGSKEAEVVDSDLVETSESAPEPTPEMTPTPNPLSPEMSRYYEVAKENMILQAKKLYLSEAIVYYQNMSEILSGDVFENMSLEEYAQEKQVIPYFPEFKPEEIKMEIPDISQEEAETKSKELEEVNNELLKEIEELQAEAERVQLSCGL